MTGAAVLVTGASGFIGTHLVDALKAAGHTVYTHDVEMGDIARCALDFEGVGHVFHLAAKSFVPESWTSPHAFYEVNVLGTVNVLEFCRRRKAALTLMSSYVYGRPRALPIAEDHPLEAFNPYSHTKILAEEVAGYYRTHFQIPVAIVRPFNIYGPGQAPHFLVPTLIRQALDPDAGRIEVTDLRPRRDFTHVRDLVRLLLATIDRQGIYNAGSGRSVGVGDLVELITGIAATGKPVHSLEQNRPEEILDTVADISRAEKELAWRPCIPIAEGLRETVEWMRARNIKER